LADGYVLAVGGACGFCGAAGAGSSVGADGATVCTPAHAESSAQATAHAR
jgi:hypothetical protein